MTCSVHPDKNCAWPRECERLALKADYKYIREPGMSWAEIERMMQELSGEK